MTRSYTHGHHESVLRSHRWRTGPNSAAYLLPHLMPDRHLLDIGAGPGTLTADLAQRVARVTATEINHEALALTRAGVESGTDSSDQATVDYATADVHALPFASESFDVVHAHQVLQHVADPVQALREMRRVTRPGGLVAARDADYRGFVWHPDVPGLREWLALYQRIARLDGGEPDAGRRLLGWAQAAGLERITPSASVWCFATPEERAWWGGMWADRVTRSAFAEKALASGEASRADLARLADAWRAWAGCADGWLTILHGEVLATIGPVAAHASGRGSGAGL